MSPARQLFNKWDPRSPVLEVAAPARTAAPALPFRPASATPSRPASAAPPRPASAAPPRPASAAPSRPAPVQGAPAAAPAARQAPAGATVSVRLLECGNARIHSIKEARALTGLGLKEAKDLVETAPVVLKSGLSRAVAEAAVARLLQAGAVADLVPDP